MAKKTSKSPAPGRKISLKKIVAEIDKVLAQLEKTGAKPRSIEGERTRLTLTAARDFVRGVCVPNFDLPEG